MMHASRNASVRRPLAGLFALCVGATLLSGCTGEQQVAAVDPTLAVYRQIDRVGRPGVKELFETFADHETSDRNSPISDPALASAITTFMTASGGPTAPGASSADAATVVATFTPDALVANLGASGSAGYLGVERGTASFGGRALADPAMETNLAVAYGNTLGTSAAGQPCLTTDHLSAANAPSATPSGAFPYVAAP